MNERFMRITMVVVVAFAYSSVPTRAEDTKGGGTPDAVSGVIVEPAGVTPERLAGWKRGGVNAVAVVLDERHPPEAYRASAKVASDAAVALYYWIEVARNPAMADAHPRWMASLGVHRDWLARFPGARRPGKGEVAKAYPWVPITSREAYDAHLARVGELLGRRAAGPYAGVLLNDLQGGPSSCGCGNGQCRWATDYRVPATATKLEGHDVAARFTSEVRKLAGGKAVVPVWTTECEDVDLPEKVAPGGKSTGLCGGIECANTTCPKAFTKQWSALVESHEDPVGVLALHEEFGRGPEWVPRTVGYLETVPPGHGGKRVAQERLWLVVQGERGASDGGVPAAPAAGERWGAGGVFRALVPLAQSFEPRVITVAQ